MEFLLLETGIIGEANVTGNTTRSDAVPRCAIKVVRGFRFNPGPEGGSVEYAAQVRLSSFWSFGASVATARYRWPLREAVCDLGVRS